MATYNIFDDDDYGVDVSDLTPLGPGDDYDPTETYEDTWTYDNYGDTETYPGYDEQWDAPEIQDLSFDSDDPDYNFDFSEDEFEYMLAEEFQGTGVPTLEDDKKREPDEEGEKAWWEKLLGNKDLLSLLAQTGIGALSGYGVKPTRTGSGKGTPTSAAPGGMIGKVSRGEV